MCCWWEGTQVYLAMPSRHRATSCREFFNTILTFKNFHSYRVICMDKAHPESSQTQILTQPPQEMCPLRVWKLYWHWIWESLISFSSVYLGSRNSKDTLKGTFFVIVNRKCINFIHNEVQFIFCADLHQLYCQIKTVHFSKRVVWVTKNKPFNLFSNIQLLLNCWFQQSWC